MKKLLVLAVLFYSVSLCAPYESLQEGEIKTKSNFPRVCCYISSGVNSLLSTVIVAMAIYSYSYFSNQVYPKAQETLDKAMAGVEEMNATCTAMGQACTTAANYLQPADEFFSLFLPLMKRCPAGAVRLSTQLIEFITKCCD